MIINTKLVPADLKSSIENFWSLSGKKILSIEKRLQTGTPVFTVNGKYTTRGWTEWTQGFQFGAALLQFDATGDDQYLTIGRKNTRDKMTPHLTHQGVHDHGFNNLSTYGNLWRLMVEGRLKHDDWENSFYELALKVSGAVQAMRWTRTNTGGFIYSFNGPQSLFVDTIRSCRILMISHCLGHVMQGENDVRINLMQRAGQHLDATARYAVYYGEGRDAYDVAGRTAHESLFNTNDGNYRCPNSQQGFSGFTTWTRGLAWAMCGFAEELEFFDALPEYKSVVGEATITSMLKAAKATCDYYISQTASDGIPYWDTGAPGLAHMNDYLNRPSEPYNDFEPVDSSAAAIAAQGLLRLGQCLSKRGDSQGERYIQAGLTTAKALLSENYLCSKDDHEGLILHSVYHRPNGWDNVPVGRKIPCNESSMWGDYHARELMIYLWRQIQLAPYHSFFSPLCK